MYIPLSDDVRICRSVGESNVKKCGFKYLSNNAIECLIGHPNIEELNLILVNATDETVRLVGSCISDNYSIKNLCISLRDENKNISGDALQSLFSGINCNLESLSILNMENGDDIIDAVENILAGNGGLKRLNLTDTIKTQKGLDVIYNALNTNYSLEEIIVDEKLDTILDQLLSLENRSERYNKLYCSKRPSEN